jgi:hypothetical protein
VNTEQHPVPEHTNITREEWRWAAVCAAVLTLVSLLPYLIAYLTTPPDLFYIGFLSNPEDGNSYLAKMQQGMRGDWLYHLPFTAEPHQGGFIFTYYIFLGHVVRWTGLSPIVLFHFVRTLNGIGLLLVLYYALSAFLAGRSQRRFAFWIAAVGSGFGWLVTLFGGMTADVWVPEGYVFYSVFVNPHFSLAIALILLMIVWSVTPWEHEDLDWRRFVALGICAAVLAAAQPLGLLPVGSVLLVYTAILWARRRRLPWREILSGVVIALVGLPFAANGYLSTTQNPMLAGWSAQNQTLSPPLYDYVLSYGVVLLLALPGMWIAARQRCDGDVLLLVWVVSVLVLLYIPYSLQRRLVMGLVVPLGILAAKSWERLSGRWQRWRVVIYAIASLTHVFVLAVSLVGALTQHQALFITKDERAALHWLNDHTAPDALIVAAPQTGGHIPAWTGRRVFYGHQFETANAEARQAQLQAFYLQGDRGLLQEDPGYVFFGPRERDLGGENWQPDAGWVPVFQQGDVIVYQVGRE